MGTMAILDGLVILKSYCKPDSELTARQKRFSRSCQLKEEERFFLYDITHFIEYYELDIDAIVIQRVAKELLTCAKAGKHTPIEIAYNYADVR